MSDDKDLREARARRLWNRVLRQDEIDDKDLEKARDWLWEQALRGDPWFWRIEGRDKWLSFTDVQANIESLAAALKEARGEDAEEIRLLTEQNDRLHELFPDGRPCACNYARAGAVCEAHRGYFERLVEKVRREQREKDATIVRKTLYLIRLAASEIEEEGDDGE